MSRNPIVAGTALAALAALAFGVTTPFIRSFGEGVGPFTTAALLYAGASIGAISLRRRTAGSQREARLRPRSFPRLFAIAFFGAALAPSLFAWGLQGLSATYASLLLNGEAVFTVILAWTIYREHVGRRVAAAVTLMFAGGAVTVVGATEAGTGGLLASLAVVGAVLCWALDNVLTRPFADVDPASVVRMKALCGAAMTGILALLLDEPVPNWTSGAGLMVCGATGYGVSLRLYLLAQRRIGAGRTGSVFALAPFVGVLAAIALGERPAGLTTLAASLLFLMGLGLHLTERHRHPHRHQPQDHDHAHRHDDGHHNHVHDVMPAGAHAHPHHHEALLHTHAHGPDLHHGHSH